MIKPINPTDLEREAVSYCYDNGLNLSPRVATDFARHFYDLGCRRTAERYDELEYNRQRAEESEKPTPAEGLEEEIKRYYDDWDGDCRYTQVARHFAEWGAEHFRDTTKMMGDSSEIPNHLNELVDYARRQVEELLEVIKKYDDYSDEQVEELRTHLMAMFLEGAGWQKKQMLKEAVEGDIAIVDYPNRYKFIDCEVPEEFNEGDKVRVIVLPKED